MVKPYYKTQDYQPHLESKHDVITMIRSMLDKRGRSNDYAGDRQRNRPTPTEF